MTLEHGSKALALDDDARFRLCPVSLRNDTSSVGKCEFGTVALPPNESARERRDGVPNNIARYVPGCHHSQPDSVFRRLVSTSYHMLISHARGIMNT